MLHIYPNPATERVHIQIDEAWPKGELQVMNALGQLVYRMSVDAKMELSVGAWPAGMYWVRYKGMVKRLVVE